MPDCKPFSLLCTKNFLALAGAFLVTIAQGGAAYPGDCAECSVRRMSAVPGGVACPLCRRLTLPFVFFLAPIPPPPFPSGEGGRIFSLFRRGLRPRHPCIRPFAALTASAMRAPRAREPAVRRNTDRSPFLSAVPAAKERGDRGRGTSAFEMVLSPGAGRASAAGKSALRARGGGMGAEKQAKGRVGGRLPPAPPPGTANVSC